MCGIVGIAQVAACENKKWLARGRDMINHRGPDDAGEWWSPDGRVGLAHCRLSIVDLTSQGHQPMHNADRGLSIVFNGEIYNHQELKNELSNLGFVFQSQSDTEALLAAYAAWGEDCLSRINGMFVFAIYDALQQTVFLARDRAGEKPLFYRLTDGQLQFGSELKALLSNPSNPRRIDKMALDCYLTIGFVPGERCILSGYQKLPPAHAMRFNINLGQAKIWRYWNLPEFQCVSEQQDDTGLLDELESLLENSVRRQLVADVSVGVLLSGGVDSSLVTAMAARVSSRVETFTIGFPGHGKFDETEHAQLVAQKFGTRHTELMAEETTADFLPRLASQFDEPIVDSSMIPTFLVSQLVRQHCTVVLGGDGGDELFGGYSHYGRLLWMQQNLAKIPYAFRKGIALASEKLLPVGFKGRYWAQGLDVNLECSLPLVSPYFDFSTRRRLLAAYADWPLVAEKLKKELIPNNPDLVQRATRMDFFNYLSEDILVKVDRASMLSSLEVRSPFLDYRLIEFAFEKVPSRLKTSVNDKKILLKQLTARLLPKEYDRRRKQGFSIPLGDWLKNGAFKELFNDVLRDPQCSFDAREVDSLLRGQEKGRSNSERLFALVLFELWKNRYGVTF